MRLKYLFIFLFTATCLIIACSKDPLITADLEQRPILPPEPFNYSDIFLPTYFNAPPLSLINSIQSDNPVTNDGATLGRVLFYDKKLSLTNTISCSSCHHQQNAFSDPVSFSRGSEGILTSRNSIAIENTPFSDGFFWDHRVVSVEQQTLVPIQNHTEMNMKLEDLLIKLSDIDYYPDLFKKAFGSTEITSDKISKALAQFIQSLVSCRSKYDGGKQNGYSDFTEEETEGMNLFFGSVLNCNGCHATENFYNTDLLNNGLDAIYTDKGLGAITNNEADNGKFKVPSLRNIEVSAPYMHDGRFATHEQVIEHYNSGIAPHPNLDARLTITGITGGAPKRYSLTGYQKAALISFLKTLTDHSFLTDVRFSNPFK